MSHGLVGRYASVLVDGAWRVSLAGWFARLVRSSAQIGAVLLVAARAGDFAIAGVAAGAVVIGAAIGGPLWSRAADRRGQQRVLPWTIVSMILAGAALIAAVDLGAPVPVLLLAALALGASSADAGSFVRARWMHRLTSASHRHTALSLESVLDEFSFVIGPPVVTIVAGAIAPELGLAIGVLASVGGCLGLLAERSSIPRPSPTVSAAGRAASWLPLSVLALLPAHVGIGLMFGSVDLTAVGIADDLGATWVAGALLAVFAVGSVTAGLVVGAIGDRGTALARLAVAGLVFAALVPWFAVLPTASGFAVASLLGGLATTPVLIAASTIIESTTDRAGVTLALTWPTVALSLGVTIGSWLAGSAIDAGDPFGATGLPLASAALVAVTLLVNAAVRSRGARTLADAS
ncbi:hypothetical protein QT381_10260 [Galbitalea sp. SE-J8]|uniref:MFS transporter n=1 Tax=Galbitalea sp. SE-J8 TaxID=3054952 RepID=UPI00259CF21C|nr:MFS transporter [Galbitalea sp. SE-J8]MDM4763391.1 hypothetical protein [Galbitalea sp. SE-J8]